jgi:hypothetical protein
VTKQGGQILLAQSIVVLFRLMLTSCHQVCESTGMVDQLIVRLLDEDHDL